MENSAEGKKDENKSPFSDFALIWVIGKFRITYILSSVIKKFNDKYYPNYIYNILIILSGGPGSGKSTICDLISVHTGYVHVSSGQALRNEISSGSPQGLALYNAMYNGEHLPNSIMTGLMRETMLSKIIGKGFAVKVSRDITLTFLLVFKIINLIKI